MTFFRELSRGICGCARLFAGHLEGVWDSSWAFAGHSGRKIQWDRRKKGSNKQSRVALNSLFNDRSVLWATLGLESSDLNET